MFVSKISKHKIKYLANTMSLMYLVHVGLFLNNAIFFNIIFPSTLRSPW